jgi:hypothetical protein
MPDWKRTNARRAKPFVHVKDAPAVAAAAPAASALLTGDYQAAPVIEAVPVSCSPPISAPVQLALPFDVPLLQLVEQVEATRIKLGLTEAAVAAKLGMKQPGFNNVKHGRDKFGPWARRRALEFLRLAA